MNDIDETMKISEEDLEFADGESLTDKKETQANKAIGEIKVVGARNLEFADGESLTDEEEYKLLGLYRYNSR